MFSTVTSPFLLITLLNSLGIKDTNCCKVIFFCPILLDIVQLLSGRGFLVSEVSSLAQQGLRFLWIPLIF